MLSRIFSEYRVNSLISQFENYWLSRVKTHMTCYILNYFQFQLVMTDPAKQREMEVKVSQSQQKITEWQEELKHLKGFTHYLALYCKNGSSIVHRLRLKSLNGKSECRTTRDAIHVHRVASFLHLYI